MRTSYVIMSGYESIVQPHLPADQPTFIFHDVFRPGNADLEGKAFVRMFSSLIPDCPPELIVPAHQLLNKILSLPNISMDILESLPADDLTFIYQHIRRRPMKVDSDEEFVQENIFEEWPVKFPFLKAQ